MIGYATSSASSCRARCGLGRSTGGGAGAVVSGSFRIRLSRVSGLRFITSTCGFRVVVRSPKVHADNRSGFRAGPFSFYGRGAHDIEGGGGRATRNPARVRAPQSANSANPAYWPWRVKFCAGLPPGYSGSGSSEFPGYMNFRMPRGIRKMSALWRGCCFVRDGVLFGSAGTHVVGIRCVWVTYGR